jgi:plastocyanin
MKRLTLAFGLVALAAVLAACSGASAAPATSDPSAAPAAPAGDAVTIVAKDMKFQPADVAVTADKPLSVVFDNQDGAPHNIAISDASGAPVFKGEIVSATKVTYAVPAMGAGTYTFICEVHPDMKGVITAK